MTETAIAIPEKTTQNLPAVDVETDSTLRRFWPEFQTLTNQQQAVLIRLVKNVASEEVQSDTQIARDLGIHRHTIINARNNPIFSRLLADITVDIVRGNVDRIVNDAFKASRDGKVSAMELLLKYSGEYIERMQSQIIHNRDDFSSIKTSDDLLGKVCRSLHRIGYTKDRLMQELDEVWTKLEDENAF